MVKKISKLPFIDTPEQAAKLDAAIAAANGDRNMLMSVMQDAQEIYGYLPYEVQCRIAEGLDVPVEKVYGVATFYAQFALTPKGKYNISVCLGTACYVKGSQNVLDKICEELGIEPGECTDDTRLHRRVRTCSRYDDKRRRIRTPYPRYGQGHPREIRRLSAKRKESQ